MDKHNAGLLFDELDEYWAAIADARLTGREVDFINTLIKKNGLILDLCCGTGRHSLRLSRKGVSSVGFDLSAKLLKIAKRRQDQQDVTVPLVRGEMRYLPFRPETFVASISMFTSYGYLPSLKDDLKSLKEVARILEKDGIFVIDIANREHLLQVFRKKGWGEFPGFFLLEKRSLDVKGSKLHSKWTIIDKKSGREREFSHNLRLYTIRELKRMLGKARLMVKAVYGDYDDGQKFSEESPRLILVARKESL